MDIIKKEVEEDEDVEHEEEEDNKVDDNEVDYRTNNIESELSSFLRTIFPIFIFIISGVLLYYLTHTMKKHK